MAAIQEEDIRALFLFIGDLNGHHQEWLGSTITNRHGVSALDLQPYMARVRIRFFLLLLGGLVCESVGRRNCRRLILIASCSGIL